MGMMEKFQGFGVVLDTFDNDQNKKNPAIYALSQQKNQWQTWDHDHDHLANRINDVVDKGDDSFCVHHYRSEPNHRMIVRYIKQQLHVYMKSTSSEEYNFCFSVTVGIDTTNHYIALSAMTGEVADKHDVQMLNVRYLDKSDGDTIDDRKLKRAGSYSRVSVKSVLYWIVMAMLNGFLLFEVVYEYWEFDRLNNQRVSPVILCQNVNAYIWIAYIMHSVIMLFALFGGRWWYIAVNAPFIGWRGYQWMTQNIKLEPIKLRKKKNVLDVGQPLGTLIKFVILAISIIFCFVNVFNG